MPKSTHFLAARPSFLPTSAAPTFMPSFFLIQTYCLIYFSLVFCTSGTGHELGIHLASLAPKCSECSFFISVSELWPSPKEIVKCLSDGGEK